MANHKRYKTRPLKKPGLPPGTIVHVGEKRADAIHITIIDFNEEHLTEKQTASVEDCFPYRESTNKAWINIDGVHQIEVIEKIGKHFEIHPLVLEDIAHVGQRPKVEEYGHYIFTELNILYYNGNDSLEAEQVSFILGKSYLITFQEKATSILNPIKERLHTNVSKIRKLETDYLMYALIDTIVDHYFVVLEKMGKQLESLEELVMKDPTAATLQMINQTKRDLIFLRKSVWPARDVISSLYRSDTPLIHETTDIYLRDVYDHTIQVIDTIENYRDIIVGIQDIYLSSITIKTNEVMKILTIITTIFVPLTFLVGIYGMNFENMPELKWPWAYFALMIIMAMVAGGMVFYFKRKKWF